MRRSKDVLPGGADDDQLLTFSFDSSRVVVTCDRGFTVIDGELTTDQAGVVYADQPFLQTHPADAADGIDRIVTAILSDESVGAAFYRSSQLRWISPADDVIEVIIETQHSIDVVPFG